MLCGLAGRSRGRWILIAVSFTKNAILTSGPAYDVMLGPAYPLDHASGTATALTRFAFAFSASAADGADNFASTYGARERFVTGIHGLRSWLIGFFLFGHFDSPHEMVCNRSRLAISIPGDPEIPQAGLE